MSRCLCDSFLLTTSTEILNIVCNKFVRYKVFKNTFKSQSVKNVYLIVDMKIFWSFNPIDLKQTYIYVQRLNVNGLIRSLYFRGNKS